MGELHLDIYVERMKREYDVDVTVGEPQVNFRETITKRAEFNYLHKKQSGGSGQYGRVIGYIEPLENGVYEFENAIIGNAIPPEYITAIDKGFQEGIAKGPMLGHPVQVKQMPLWRDPVGCQLNVGVVYTCRVCAVSSPMDKLTLSTLVRWHSRLQASTRSVR